MIDSIVSFTQQFWDHLPESIKQNQFLSGGLLIGALMAALNVIRSWPGKIWPYIIREVMIEVRIEERDPAFNWIKEWLSHQSCGRTSRNLDISLMDNQLHSFGNESPVAPAVAASGRRKRPRPKFILSPGLGTHLFLYRGRLVWLTRSKDNESEPGTPSAISSRLARESFKLRFFSRSREVVANMLNDVIDTVLPEDEPKMTTYSYLNWSGWRAMSVRKTTNCRNLILPSGVLEGLLKDAALFLGSRDWYEQLGLPYRRGYLFYGEPGSGKSTTAIAMASNLDLDVASLSLNSEGMDDVSLMRAILDRPASSILLLEDIDCLFEKRDAKKEGGVTFSGLLNVLDGVGSSDGTILIMTTNHLDRLDPALIRPGRADYRVEYTKANTYQSHKMFHHFFPEAPQEEGWLFAEATENKRLSMCGIQEVLIRHRSSPTSAIEHVNSMPEAK